MGYKCHYKQCEHIGTNGFCYRNDCFHSESGRVKTSRTEKGKYKIDTPSKTINKIKSQLYIILGDAYIDQDSHSDICIKEIIEAANNIMKIIDS